MTRLFFFCVFALFVLRGLGHSWGPFQTYVHLSEKNDGIFTASIPLHVDTFVGPVSFSMVCPIPTQVCITHEMSVSQTREYLEKDCATGSFMQFKAGGNSTDPFRIHPLAPVNYPETYVHADSALGTRKFSRKEDAGIHRQMNTAYLREGNNFITVATKKKGEHIAGNYTNCVLQWYGHQCNAGVPVHSDCAPLEEIHVNRSYHSRLPPDSWTFYLLDFDLDRRVKELEIRVNGTEADDVAVYMRLGGAPVVDGSTVIADAYADKATNNMLVASVLEPSQGRWIIGFHNKNTRKVHTVNFQLTAYKCGNTSVIGLHCNRNITDLSNTRHASEHEFDGDDDWNYFVIRQRRSIKVGVAPADAGDDVPELYVNIENPPNNQGLVVKGHKDVNFASLSTTVGPTKKRQNRALAHFVSHAAAAHHDDDDGVNWYIGVKGSGKYHIWANSYCADSCNGHGTCNTHTGICDCDSGYEGFDCVKDSSSSGFKPVYIILIIIGGLIVLAVAIGVPLAIFLRNRHRQSYEKL